MRIKFRVFTKILSIKFKRDLILVIHDNNIIIKYIMSKGDVLLVIHNFSELKSLVDNAKIRSLLKLLLVM